MLKSNIINFRHQSSCHITKGSDVTPSVLIDSSVNYQHNSQYQPVTKMHINQVMDLVPYNFDPVYSVK